MSSRWHEPVHLRNPDKDTTGSPYTPCVVPYVVHLCFPGPSSLSLLLLSYVNLPDRSLSPLCQVDVFVSGTFVPSYFYDVLPLPFSIPWGSSPGSVLSSGGPSWSIPPFSLRLLFFVSDKTRKILFPPSVVVYTDHFWVFLHPLIFWEISQPSPLLSLPSSS